MINKRKQSRQEIFKISPSVCLFKPFIGPFFSFIIPLIGKKIPIVGNQEFLPVFPTIGRVKILDRGFTLIELVITLTVVGILAIIAVPSYQWLVESSRLTAATNDLVADLSFIRVEAMKRGVSTQAGVCASSDGASCTTGSTTWTSGWIVFVDADNNGTYNAGDTILKVHSSLSSSLTAVTNPASTNTLIFNHMGAIATSITSLLFSDTKINNLNRTICLSGGTGRAMVANNGVSCP